MVVVVAAAVAVVNVVEALTKDAAVADGIAAVGVDKLTFDAEVVMIAEAQTLSHAAVDDDTAVLQLLLL